MKRIENDCVGCPQGCIHCGRERDYIVWECDECGELMYSEDEVEEVDGKDFCSDCYEKLYEEELEEA